jgi:AraC-like DNA-binding protein
LDETLAVPISAISGVGALLSGFLAQLSAGQGDYTHADLPRLGNVLVDLMNATLAHPLDAKLPDSAGPPPLLLRIIAFIEQHLDDARLSPTTIASAHFISVSHLHRLFQAHHHMTVAAFVRTQRLQRARRDLSDPQLLAVPIHRIAARWGFADHATFTRTFRAQFGVPPSSYRLLTEPSATPDDDALLQLARSEPSWTQNRPVALPASLEPDGDAMPAKISSCA